MSFREVLKRRINKGFVAMLALVGAVFGASIAFAGDPGVASRIDYAMNFDGTGSYLSTTNQMVSGSSDFTIQAYARVDSASATNDNFIFAVGTDGGSYSNFVGAGIRGGCWVLYLQSPGYQCASKVGRVNPGEWALVAVTYSQSTGDVSLYVNGVLAEQFGTYQPTWNPGFTVGRNAVASSGFFKGQIDEVKVFNTIRTPANMLTDSNNYLAANTAGLVASYDFNEGSTGLGKIYDRTSNNNDLNVNGSATFSDIAQYTNTSRTSNSVRFNRSYLTLFGGWFGPPGTTNVSGYLYGAGGGGGSGAATNTGSGGGGGGGGAAGARTYVSFIANPDSAITIQIGLGGAGGTVSGVVTPPSAGFNGVAGGQSRMGSSTTAAGGVGGFGGGLANGSTDSPGLGGKGGGSSFDITSSNDGGGGQGFSSPSANSRTGGAGTTDANSPGTTFMVGGLGGLGKATAGGFHGTLPTPNSGSGGGGGGGSDATLAGWPGAIGANGAASLGYTVNNNTSTGFNTDFLVNFNGTTQYLTAGQNSTDFDLTGNFTLQTWLRATNNCPTGFCTVVGRDNNYLIGTSNGTFWWQVATNTGSSTWYNTGVPVTPGQWQHVALVRSGASISFLLNGQVVSTRANGDLDASGSTIALTSTSQVGTGVFAVAARGIDREDKFAGLIDEVRLWNVARTEVELGDPATGDFNRPLTTAELASANLVGYWSMNDGSTSFFMNLKTGSTGTTDLALIGAPSTSINGAQVAITNRYMDNGATPTAVYYAPDSPAFEVTGSNFTISGWWRIFNCSATNYFVTKANTYSIATDSNCNLNFQLDPGNEGDAQSWQWMNTGYVMPTTAWKHVTLTKVGTTAYVYIDGVLVSTIQNGDSVQTFNNAGNVTAVVPASLGDRATSFGFASLGTGATRTSITRSLIDDVRIWNTDRRANVRLDMYGFVNRTATGLQAMFDFNIIDSATPSIVINMARGADFNSHLLSSSGNSLVANTAVPPGQPRRVQQLIQRSIIINSTQVGVLPAGGVSNEYWVVGGGGGGGTAGTSGGSGAGGGAGELAEGVMTGLTEGTASQNSTIMKVGVGGRYAANSGDSLAVASNPGTATTFSQAAQASTAVGGGAGGSAVASPVGARNGGSGAAGGGGASGSGSAGASTAGFVGGAGSTNAAGGGGGEGTAGTDATGTAGGSGGRGFLIPIVPGQFSPSTFFWGVAGGSGHGSGSSPNTQSSYGSTAAGADAAIASGSGGGGNGFASAGTGVARGGLGGNGFILVNSFLPQPYADTIPTGVQSGVNMGTLVVSFKDIYGNTLTGISGQTITITAVSGCTIGSGTTSVVSTNGVSRFNNIVLNSTTTGTCQLQAAASAYSTSTQFDVPIRTSATSVTISTAATTGTCSFVSGLFSCPNTAAILNVNDLNTQLAAGDVVVPSSGAITINSGLAITGSVGSLTLNAGGGIIANSGIALTGSGKGLFIRSNSFIYFNDAATSSAQTTYSTNGGEIFLQSGAAATTSSDYPIKLSNYNNFVTNGGNFTASGSADVTTGYASGGPNTRNRGVNLFAGTTISTGSGNVLIRARLGGSSVTNQNPNDTGFGMEAASSITTTSGNVTVVGLNPGFSDTGSYRRGIDIAQATITTDSGNVNLTSETGTDGSAFNVGIAVAGSTLSSNSGSITLFGGARGSNNGFIKFSTPQTTIGSTTGNVTLQTPTGGSSATSIDNLKLTGGGTHTISIDVLQLPAVSAGSTQFLGTGDLLITTPGSTRFVYSLTLPANLDVGSGYKTIRVTDGLPVSASSITVNDTLRASDFVSLAAGGISGTGAVIAPKLAMNAMSTSSTVTSRLSGASEVNTLALNRATKPLSCTSTYVGIVDATGWAPGTVNGVSPVFGLPTKLAITTQPATATVTPTSAQNQPLGQQPVVQAQDAWDCSPSDSTALAGYSVTPTANGSAMSGLNSLTTDANGRATFSGITPLSTTLTTLTFNSSPVLTSATSSGFSAAASSNRITQATVTQGSTTAVSGVNLTTQPRVTYYDAWGNVATLAASVTPTIALTSFPAGASASSLTNTAASASASAVWTGTGFRITGPTGRYTITFTANSAATGNVPVAATLNVDVTGWTVGYGASTLNYQTTAYPVTFQGNGTGAVTYSSSTTSVCTVNSTTGALTPVTAGSCTITANQASDGTNPSGSASVTLTIAAGPQSTVNISAPSSNMPFGTTLQLTGSGGDGTGTIGYAVASGNCTVGTSSGVLSVGTARGGDTCVVYAYRTATTGRWLQTNSANLTINVTQGTQAAVVVPTGRTVGYSNTVDLSSFTYSGGSGTGALSFTTSTAGCSITGTILTSFANVNTNCVVVVQKAASTDYLASAPVNMNVQTVKGNQTITFATVASSVKVRESVTLSATSSSGLAVTYTVDPASSTICSISGSTVTFNRVGTCTVNANQAGDSNVNAAPTQPITYTVAKGDQTITFAAIADKVVSSPSFQAVASANSGLAVSFAVGSNTTNSACSVTSSGLVSLAAVGVCEIVASQAGDTDYNAAVDVAQSFNVGRGTQSALVITSASSVAYGNTINLTATGGNGTSAYVWNATGTCSVSGSTLTVGDAGSSCVVTLDRAGDANWFDATQVSQTITINKASQAALSFVGSTSVVFGTTLILNTTGGSGTGSLTYSTTGTCAEANGILTVGNAGSACTVTATKAGDTNYLAGTTGAVTFTVTRANQATLTITSGTTVKYAQTLALTTSGGSGSGAVSYSTTGTCSVSGSTLTVSNAGSACTVTATKAQSTNYNSVDSSAVTITVVQGDQTVSISSNPVAPKALGTYSVTASATSGLTVAISIDSSTSAVCSASGTTITFIKSGTCLINANQAGDSNWNSAPQVQQSVTVGLAAQTITFTNPGTKNFGNSSFTAQATSNSGLAIIFSVGANTTNNSCSVTSSGTVTVADVGTCELLANQAGNDVYDAASEVAVSFAIARGAQVALNMTSASSVVFGNTLTLTSSGGSGTGSVTYSTTGTCSVSGTTLTVGNAGSACSVTATKAGDSQYTATSSSAQTITITKADQSITFTSAAVSPTALGTYTVAATSSSGLAVTFAIDSSTASVCSVSGSTVSFQTGGNCLINADQSGNTNYNAAPQAQQLFNVAKAAQTISFTNPGSKSFGSAAFQVVASSNSGLSIAFTRGASTTNTACSVSSTGLVTILDVGTCEIVMDQAGDATYLPATTASFTFAVGKGSQATLSMSSASSVAYGSTITLSTTGGSGTGAVSYSTTGTCSVNSGILSVGNAGSACTVAATKAADSQYNSATSAAQTITVNKADQTVALTSGALSPVALGSYAITASATSGLAVAITVDASTASICSFSSGNLTFARSGLCKVNLNQGGDSNFNAAAQVQESFTATKAAQTISITNPGTKKYTDASFTLVASATSGLSLNFAVGSNTTNSSCSVAANGTVTINDVGTCEIVADQSGDNVYSAAQTVTVSFAIGKGDQSALTITSSSSVVFGNTLTLTTSGGSGSGAVTFATTGTCSVSGNTLTVGVVGSACSVTATKAADSQYLATDSAAQTITITRAAQATLTISSASSATFGSTITLSTAGGSGDGAISYSTTGTCTETSGILTLGNVGDACTVTATKAQSANYNAATSAAQTVTVTRATQQTLTITSANSVAFGGTITLATTGGSGSGAITYSTTGTCSVSNGILSVGNVGDACTVTATKAQSANYNAATSAAQTVTVTKASQTVSFVSTPSNPTALVTYSVVATATSGLTVAITVDASAASVCSISGTTVTFLTSGNCVLNANQAGNGNFDPASQVQQSITVGKASQTISLTNPGPTAFGAASFAITGSASSGLTITYSLGSGTTNSACSVTSGGQVTVNAVGQCEINADQSGDSTYLAASTATVNFSIGRVNQATLTISSASSATFGTTITLSTSGGSGSGAVTYATTGTCSETAGILTLGSVGDACTVTATKAGDASYLIATSATQTVTVTPAAQAAFSISSATSVTYGNTLVLTTTGGSGSGSVSYATTGTCSVAANLLTVGDAGSACSVTATKAASTNYSAATSAAVTITINKANQTVNFTSTASGAIALGTYSVAATASSGLSVAITVDAASASVCSISGSTVTYLTAGSCVLNANQVGGTNYNAATQVQQSISVALKSQTVTWNNWYWDARPVGTAPFTVAATASSGLPVRYTIGGGSTGGCTVDQNTGLVTITAAGTCILFALQGGNATWEPWGTASASFNITQGTQATLTITSATTVPFQGSLALTTAGGSGTGGVSYTATGACTVSGNVLTPGEVGTACTVTATKDGDVNWLPTTSASVSIATIKIDQAALSVNAPLTVPYGTTVLLTTTGGSGDGAVTYSTVGTCTVSGSTLILGNVGDYCKVDATKAASRNYNAVSTIGSPIVFVTSIGQTIGFSTSPVNPVALSTYTPVVTASSGLPVTITVDASSASVCSISGAIVTYLTSGSCVLNASQPGNTNYDPAVQIQQTITVAKASQTISFAQPADVTVLAQAFNIAATASSNLQIAYAVGSNTTNSACAVTASGQVTPQAVGLCEVTADQAGDATYSAAPRVTRSFNVIRANQASLSISSASTVVYGNTVALSTSGGSGTGAVSYSTTGTCSATGSTLVVGNAGSLCTVTATKAADSTYNAATSAAQTVTISRAAQPTLQIASANQMAFGQTLALSFTGGAGTGSETYSIDTSSLANSASCSVNNVSATLSATSTGSCQVVVTKAASTNYNAATSSAATVTVVKANQSINFTSNVPNSPVSGGTYLLTASATSGLAVSFSLAAGSSSFCSLSGSTVTFTATGNCVVNANQAGNGNFNAATTVAQTIAIGSLNQTITFPAIPNKTFGGASFAAAASVPSTSPIVYSLGAATTNSACSVTSNGVVSILAVGRCEIVAAAAADAQYATASNVSRVFDVVADRAGAPFITSVSASNASVTVSFTAPSYTGGAPITGYEIYAYRNGLLVATGNNCAANATSCTIAGLTNGFVYTIKMAAVNAAGSGIESAASSNITPYTNPGAVSALAAVAANNALNLSWQAPASLGGGTFVSYQVFVRQRGGSYPVTPTATLNSVNSTTYTVSSLTNGQAYDIKVVAITTAASTQLVSNTTEIQQTPMTVPDAPQQLTVLETSDGVLNVSWATPNSDGGSPITGYSVDLGNGHNCSVPAQTTSCIIPNLTSLATYTVAARATNAAGTSLDASVTITLRPGTAVTSSGSQPFTAAFGITVDSVRAFASIDRTDRKLVSTAGGSRIVITGFGLDKVERVVVEGKGVKILAKTRYEMLLQLPGSSNPGWADLWFYATGASLRYVDGIYFAQATVLPKPIVKLMYGFVSPMKSLTSWQKALIRATLKSGGSAKSITVTGYSAGARLTAKYVQTLLPTTPIKVVLTKARPGSVAASIVKLTFTK